MGFEPCLARPAGAGYAASHIAPATPNERTMPPRLRSSAHGNACIGFGVLISTATISQRG